MWQRVKNHYHLGQAILANLLYWFPSRKLKVIGVTGTDGKTTTSSMIYHILDNAGYKAALISSVGAVINNNASDIGFHVTTPGRFALQSYLKKSKKQGVEYVVIELTSHALDQYRAYGIPVEVGVLTNISNEHLDYHKTYEKYVKAKARLFKISKIVVLNKDDKSYEMVKKYVKNKKVITYGLGKSSDVNPSNFLFKVKLIGKFNMYNSLAAVSALRSIKMSDAQIRKGIESFRLPAGRQEIIYDKEFLVINDFAHTPNSFLSVIPEIKKLSKGKLIHVFGAAAKRDTYKRSEMGKISSESADIIILTAEDSRGESVEEINKEIISGIKNLEFETINLKQFKNTQIQKNKKYVFSIPNRKEAIKFAIAIAQKGDVVLLTGKGHEKSINYGRGEEPWNESMVALEAIKQIRTKG